MTFLLLFLALLLIFELDEDAQTARLTGVFGHIEDVLLEPGVSTIQ